MLCQFTSGPKRVTIQPAVVIAQTRSYNIMVATEFVSSGSDYYKIFFIDDLSVPFEPSISAKFYRPQQWAIRQDSAIAKYSLNKYNQAFGFKTETFTKVNATEQQIYRLKFVVRANFILSFKV